MRSTTLERGKIAARNCCGQVQGMESQFVGGLVAQPVSLVEPTYQVGRAAASDDQ